MFILRKFMSDSIIVIDTFVLGDIVNEGKDEDESDTDVISLSLF